MTVKTGKVRLLVWSLFIGGLVLPLVINAGVSKHLKEENPADGEFSCVVSSILNPGPDAEKTDVVK